MTYRTRQEIYTTVRTHLLTQGRPARMPFSNEELGSSNGRCMYRTPDGLKCAIGALIPDDVDTAPYEGRGIMSLPTTVLEAMRLEPMDYDFAAKLQYVHDKYQPAEWPEQLDHFAAEHRLRVE